MFKVKQMILMLCLIFSGAWCYANTNIEKDGHPVSIELMESTGVSGSDRSSSIAPVINGHVLTVTFIENMGQVTVEVTTTSGASVQCLSVFTPNGLQVYIPNAGNYIVTFTLPNGDEYYGEFTITD